jgi:predicted Fe-Mo cluster-binding NifX family protein
LAQSRRTDAGEKERKPMKIAVSAQGNNLDAKLDPRFDRARWFILHETEEKGRELLDNVQVADLP